jgi:4'-phosphopantetheinyl transferase
VPGPGEPDVVWSLATESADQVLTSQLARLYETVAGSIAIGRLCPNCASSAHGRPWARTDGIEVPVSLSRTHEWLVTAVGTNGRPIGVDVESLAEVARIAPSGVLAAGESAADEEALARLWVAKEAILKEYGVGLARPMSSLAIADYPGVLVYLDAPTGFVAALASGG